MAAGRQVGESAFLIAKRIGALQIVSFGPSSSSKGGTRKRRRRSMPEQILSHVFVLDFESTCWNDKVKRHPEVIEFSTVLMSLSSGKIIDEFQMYVEPQEHPNLSAFCSHLTGIKQSDVAAAMPLRYCMRSFKQWIDKNVDEHGLRIVTPSDVIPDPESKRLKISDDLEEQQSFKSNKWASFITWTDWDLKVCLKHECDRKHIVRPSYLNCWIDLKTVYTEFYERRPAGLNGALSELGLKFVGREHSGIDDARNTAILAHRVAIDGCLLSITKTIKNS